MIAVAVGLLYVSGAIYLHRRGHAGYWKMAGHHININDSLYLGTFSRAGGLMLGAGFATLWRPMAILRGPLRHKAARVDLVAAIGLVATLAMMGTMYLTEQGGSVYNPWLYRGGFFAVGITSLMMIAGATHQLAKTGSVLGNKVFLWIGTRSYGLYLFHWPVYQFIRKQADIEMSLAQIGVAMAITLPVTELSYRFIETPIRAGRLGEVRRLFTASGAHVMASISVVAMLGTAVYSLGSADPHCVGSVRCSLVNEEGSEPTSSTQPTDTQPTGTTDPTGVTTDSTAATATPTTVAAKKYVAIGESVMEGAFVYLETARVTTFAKEGRGPEGAKNAMIKYRDLGYIGLGTQVIVQVGHNAPMGLDEIDAIMNEVPDGAGQVWFMTIHGDAAWIEDNNAVIRAIPTTYPDVKIIDWDTAASGTTLCSDGMHLTCNGEVAKLYYTNVILSALGLPAIE